MKTIKIIDLLNKIANGEEVPKKIGYCGICWTFNNNRQSYRNESGIEFEEWNDGDLMHCLTDEVELIKEDKEIEEIKSHYVLGLGESLEQVIEWQKENNKIYEDKINELVKVVNSIKKGN